jgi:L-alanine-DL-glutamate epimerase-like enolase superfamily enzyme
MIGSVNKRIGRRHFLGTGAVALAGLAAPWNRARSLAAEAGVAEKGLTIEAIERTTVKLEYRPVPKRAMDRELPHWRWSEICEVHLACGAVGHGETLLYYTWGVTGDDDVERAKGKNAAELMWDDSLGAGLQMALFDAVGRAAGVPVHRLLGHQVHQRTPLSWWNIDTPPEDMAAECAKARRHGYTAYKTKGRPWFDVWEQVKQASAAVPESFKIDIDFNDTLLDAKRAIPILKELEQYPQIDIYETPIPQRDVEGNKAIRAATRVKIAMHYGSPRPVVAIREQVCDGFVVGGGAQRVIETGHVAAMADMPFWLQLVGSGLTAAFSMHFGAVLSHATWPAVNCHQLYTHTLLSEPIVVEDGFAAVPTKPGLGYELDKKAVEQFRVEKATMRPDPPRMLEVSWLDGRKMYFASNNTVNFVVGPAARGRMPFYERGVTARLLPNDGSMAWRRMYEKACEAPYLVKGE